ncbi:MAG: aminopeptidase [Ruminococcaceae bacterium]|nr:aminopeptidase [Oscillospiraceae bacterium]
MKDLKEKLFYDHTNVYQAIDEGELESINEYAKGYMSFMTKAKTEREATAEGVAMAQKEGFVPYTMGMPLEVGGKYYYNNRGKALYLFIIGSENIENGIRISAAHVDSPRLDLKQVPLYEESEMGFFKTHYYGGIKKYQWTTIPLALHGVIYKKDGERVDVTIGEDDEDPVFYINDLLPHLGKDQMKKPLAEAFTGEDLNILIGSEPVKGETKDSVKLHVMMLLNEKYGITEADFLSAELTAVPAFKPRYVGFDRSLIAAYGHDDKVCAYPALTALFENKSPKKTLMTILADKEEIGSEGNTGMKCQVFTDIMEEIAKALGGNYHVVKENSKCLSADVNAAFDPNFAEVYERKNSSYINHGIVMTKFTGARGKSGSSDASAEYVSFVRRIFDEHGVIWQTGELGKVDQGGGGTVAAYIAQKNIDTVDLGVAVISMHAPIEVISKADLYMAHKAFSAFNK